MSDTVRSFPDRARRAAVLGIVTSALLAVLLPGCAGSASVTPEKKQRERRFLVRTAPVATRPVTYALESTGSLQAKDIFRIDAQVPGVVEGVAFNEGDEVTKETLLCRIAPRTYELAVQQAQAALVRARQAHLLSQADLADTERKARYNIDQAVILNKHADRDYQRRKIAFDGNAITEEELLSVQDKRDLSALVLKNAREAAQTEVQVARAAVEEKAAAAKQAEVTLADAEENLRKSRVMSPVSGRIEQRMVANGAQISSGTAIAQVIDLELRLRFSIPEEQVAKVQTASRLTFRVLTHPGRDFEATIYFIGTQTDAKTRMVTGWAYVAHPPDAVLKAGFFATVRIVTEEHTNAVVIPLTSVQPTERGFVAYVVENGLAQRRPITLGLQLADEAVEILSGIKAGETVVVEGANSLIPNAPVMEAGAADGGGVPQKQVRSDTGEKGEKKDAPRGERRP